MQSKGSSGNRKLHVIVEEDQSMQHTQNFQSGGNGAPNRAPAAPAYQYKKSERQTPRDLESDIISSRLKLLKSERPVIKEHQINGGS